MGNIFDIIILAAPFVSVFICYKLGFFKLLKPFWKIMSFVLAWSLRKSFIIRATVGKLINSDGIKSTFKGWVDKRYGDELAAAAGAEGMTLGERFDDVFGFMGEFFGDIKNFCMSLYDQKFSDASALPEQTAGEKIDAFVNEVVDFVAVGIADFIMGIIGYIILQVVFYVLFWLIVKLLDGVLKDTKLGKVNRIIGGAVGIIYGLLAAWLLSVIFVLLIPRITGLTLEQVTGGLLGITEKFYTGFFLSHAFGLKL